jgi:hypothetical protein
MADGLTHPVIARRGGSQARVARVLRTILVPLFALGSEPIKLSCEQYQRLLGGPRRGGLLLTGLATELKSFVAALFEDRGDLIDKALPGHLTPPP